MLSQGRTNVQALELFIKAVPYSQHITDLDLSDPEALRLTWRHDRWRVCASSLMVERMEDGCLIGDNASILIEALLKRQDIQDYVEASR